MISSTRVPTFALTFVLSMALFAAASPVAVAEAPDFLATPDCGAALAEVTASAPAAPAAPAAPGMEGAAPEPIFLATPECGYGREYVGCCYGSSGAQSKWRCKQYCCKDGWCGLLCDKTWCENPCIL